MSWVRGLVFTMLSAAGLLPLVGCGEEEPVMVVRTADPSRQAIGSFGLVTLMQGDRPGEQGFCLKLTGQFVHYSHLHPEAVIRAIDPEIGRLPNEGVLGQCSEIRADARPEPVEEAETSNAPFAIDLLDAGNLVVRSPARTFEIEPRVFPDVLASVGGVVYGAASEDCIPLTSDGELGVQTGGGPDVGPFSVTLPVPQRPEIGAVNGIPPQGGQILLGHPLDGSLQVQWQPADNGSDVFHIELESDGWRVFCLVPDRGSFTVPASSLAAAPARGPLHLQVRRIHVQPFTAPGIRDGEIVTIVHDEVTVTRGDED